MPKLIRYETLSENKFQFENYIRIRNNDARIQVPKRLGDQIKDKKVRVTVEVIEDENI